MVSIRFKNNLQFALRKEAPEVRGDIPLNRLEQLGNLFSWFVYEFKKRLLRTICDPRFITVVFTVIAMILTSLLFYPSDTWSILSRSLNWTFDLINWSYVRFGLWMLSEITIVGLGMRAFGRFSNPRLMEAHNVMA